MEQLTGQECISKDEQLLQLRPPAKQQRNELYQQKIQKMINQVSTSLRCYLTSVTYIYKQNGIDYSVNQMHKKFMRQLAPPLSYLGLNDDEDDQHENRKQEKKIACITQNGINAEQKPISNGEDEYYSQIFEEKSQPEPRIQDEFLKQRLVPLFCGTNPTGISRRVKQFQKMKGNQLHKQSSKMLRHSQKYFLNFEERLTNKNNPNKPRKRKPRRTHEQIQQQKINKKNTVAEYEYPNKKGRRISNIGLENQIYHWIIQQMKNNIIVKKIDIRHQFQIFSDGQYSGSTGWCRRFLQRHPEIQMYLTKQRQEVKIQKLNAIPKKYLSSDSEQARQNDFKHLQEDDSGSEIDGQLYPQNCTQSKFDDQCYEQNSEQTTRAKR